MKYSVYCDGSTKANGKENSVGAWAYALINEDWGTMTCSKSEAVANTTNQRMELQAAIEGIKVALPLATKNRDIIIVYTDSAYLHNCYQQRWYDTWQRNGWKNAKKQPVANQDLWEQLIPYFESFGIEFKKVKGHSNNSSIHSTWNNYVDDLAQTAAARLQEELKQC